MRDLFDRIIENKGPLGKWAAQAEGYFVFPKLEGPISNRMKFQGREMITWSINDYLGLANLPEIKKVDGEAALEHGAAYPMGARMMSGHTRYHEQLEKELAEFVSKESAYLLNFGYQGIMSAIDALVSKDDIIVYDVDSHACIIDGVRLCKAMRYRYANGDMADLEKQLKQATSDEARFKIIVTDGVFSMDGLVAPLDQICDLADQYDALVMIDECHATGFIGEHGIGTLEDKGVMGRVDIITGTLGKALGGAMGGYTTGKKEIIEMLRQRSRPYLFSNSLAPSLIGGTLKVFDLLEKSHDLKQQLDENTAYFKKGIKAAGFDKAIREKTGLVTDAYFSGTKVAWMLDNVPGVRERAEAGEEFVHDGAKRVQVGSRRQLLGLDLFRRHVARAAGNTLDTGYVGVRHERDAEIDDAHVVVERQHDVARLDVAMNEAELVSFIER